MKLKFVFPALLILLTGILMSGCRKKLGPMEGYTGGNTVTSPGEGPVGPVPGDSPKPHKTPVELLQGKWQHAEDLSNFLVFEGNKRKEIADGMTEWDVSEYVISDKCMNAGDADDKSGLGTDAYMSDVTNDLCWVIVTLNEEWLSLMYVGRGNTLTYKKVKDN